MRSLTHSWILARWLVLAALAGCAACNESRPAPSPAEAPRESPAETSRVEPVAPEAPAPIVARDGVSAAPVASAAEQVERLSLDPSGRFHALFADDRAAADRFGHALALSGTTLAVGAPHESDTGTVRNGAVYLFESDGKYWRQADKLVADDKREVDHFGHALALSGDLLVVGAPSGVAVGMNGESLVGGDPAQFPGTGVVYVFEREGATWRQQARLVADEAVAGDNFGFAVALDGATLVVGAHWRDDAEARTRDSGAVYVFEREPDSGDWRRTQALYASDASTDDFFGASLALAGDTLLVGAWGEEEDMQTLGSGAVYAFEREGGRWREAAKLRAAEPARNERFGASVSLSGDALAVGANGAGGEEEAHRGAVYLFERGADGAWAQRQRVLASDGARSDAFGLAVALWDRERGKRLRDRAERGLDRWLAVGAFSESDAGLAANGAAYVFAREGEAGAWQEVGKLFAGTPVQYGIFGSALALSGSTLAVGAVQQHDADGVVSGAVYVFDLEAVGNE